MQGLQSIETSQEFILCVTPCRMMKVTFLELFMLTSAKIRIKSQKKITWESC